MAGAGDVAEIKTWRLALPTAYKVLSNNRKTDCDLHGAIHTWYVCMYVCVRD
jgi:hypothetical protein